MGGVVGGEESPPGGASEEAAQEGEAIGAAAGQGDASAGDAAPPPRAGWCAGCERKERICLCPALPADRPLDTRSRIVLFIHPKEVKRALGTAPLLKLCLGNLLVYENDRFPEPEEDAELHASLYEEGRQPVLVCPGPEQEVLRAPVVEPDGAVADVDVAPAEPPRTLIFVDGRWPQAKAMVNRSAWLKGIPRVVLVPTEQSYYRFRKQPEQGCLSTLEAVAESLLCLEGGRGPALKAALMAPFRRMVDLQCDFIPEGDTFDKNARLAGPEGLPQGLEAEQSRLFFDLQAVRQHPRFAELLAAPLSAEAASLRPCERSHLQVIVRWGEKGLTGRPMVIVEFLYSTLDDAKVRARQLSEGKVHGQRYWVTNPRKVPHGSPCEAPEGVPQDQLPPAPEVPPPALAGEDSQAYAARVAALAT